jgi:hypothetical protein
MYVADGNEVYYCNPDETGLRELFLTVHPTKDCTKTTREQAIIIADMLNDDL